MEVTSIMMTVKEVSTMTGVSIRTLQYYDRIGLLHPTSYTASGYRLYDNDALEKLQLILLFRSLEFPLKEIKEIIESPDFDRKKALEQQISLLELKKEHIQNLINFAKTIKMIGVRALDFSVFDTSKIDEYTAKAKKEWGNTPAYKEFEEKNQNRPMDEQKAILAGLMEIFVEFGAIKDQSPDSKEAQDLVKKLQDYISEHFYHCTDQILTGLGKMYSGGGEFTENIDNAGGNGTGVFADQAIQVYCGLSAEP